MKKHPLIAVCGGDGAGKSTVITGLQNYIGQKGLPLTNVREPGGTPLAEQLRVLHKAHREEAVSPMTELLMMYASRVQLFENVIIPSLAHSAVLSDRFWGCSYAYQLAGATISEEQFWSIHNTCMADYAEYDLVLYLDIDPTVGHARLAQRGEADRLEAKGLNYAKKVRQNYIALCDATPNMKVVDASQSPEDVLGDVIDHFSGIIS